MMENFKQTSGWTNIFIYPGYEFKAIDGMITNSIYQSHIDYAC